MKSWIWALGLVASSALAAVPFPPPEVEKLPNGLQVAWFVSDKVPVVDLGLVVESGSRWDPPGKSGTAEILSSLLERGFDGKDATEVARQIENLGASRYSSADDDIMSIGLHGLASDAEKLMTYLFGMIRRPTLTREDFDREKSRMIDRWSHLGDSVESLAGFTLGRLTAEGTPYARGSFLSLRELKAIRYEDVRDFYQSHFVPSRSILLVVGRVDLPRMRALVRQGLESWKDVAAPPVLPKITSPRSEPGAVWLIDRPGATQAQVRMGFTVPVLRGPDRFPLALANSALGEMFQSRLNRELRDQQGLTYGASSSLAYDKDLGRLFIGTSTQNAKVAEVLLRTRRILADLKKNGITAEELSTAKEYLSGSFPLGLATLGSVAARWVNSKVYGLPEDDLSLYLSRLNAVTLSDANRSVRKVFPASGWSTVIAGDRKALEPILKKAGIKNLRFRTAKDLLGQP